MTAWECERCGRRFGASRSHTCIPATTVDAFFEARPPWQRAIHDAVSAHIESLGPVIVEAVDVGIFFKRRRNFVELRPRQHWLNLSFMLSRPVDHPRISRVISGNGRHYHVVRVTGPEDVDSILRDWLTESYFAAQ